jgi:peptidoglycan hydrolase-like protein with peptidoglycan-binding domain
MARVLAPIAGVVVLVGAVAGGYALRSASQPETPPPSTIATATAKVVRTDLVQTETLVGTLEYADPGQVVAAIGGTVTSLPTEAQAIDRGDRAFELDGTPVFAMIGDRPSWRPFAKGMTDGPDVLQLEENLSSLGYGPDGWKPDQKFDSDTAAAIEDWRSAVGLVGGSEVEQGLITFVPSVRRVGALQTETGRLVAPGTPMFDTTSAEQLVVIDLDPKDIDLVAVGAAVSVKLPDDRVIGGIITEVGRVVVPSGQEPDAPGVIEVKVTLDEAVLAFDQAPVDVDVESARAASVLAVPVRALLALSDGGYAVQVGDTLVKVTTGEFANGLVEVTGALSEGDEVVIPK